jgi:tetratricopeptide (TPR) repeat protein
MERNNILSATLADIYLEQGYLEKAIEIYGKLARREPENEFYRRRLAALKKEMKEKSKAPAFRKILSKKLW